MDKNKIMEEEFKNVPSKEEKEVLYKNLISKIYRILTSYEKEGVIEESPLNWIVLELKTYGHIYEEKLFIVSSWLQLLYNKELNLKQIRKIVLDCTNYISRLI